MKFSAPFASDEVQKTANLAIKDRRNYFFEKALRPQFRGFFELADFEGAYKNIKIDRPRAGLWALSKRDVART